MGKALKLSEAQDELLSRERALAKELALKITHCWRQSVVAIIETGQLLIDAKAVLRHGQWLPMVKNDLPFSPRVAQALMKLAKDQRLLTHLEKLPPAWGTLVVISRLGDKEFDHRIADGIIRPDMERLAIERIRRQPQLIDTEFLIGESDVRRWAVKELRDAAKALSAIAEHLGAAASESSVGDCISNIRLRALMKIGRE